MNASTRNSRGMTLMEIMVAMAVMTLIVTSVWNGFQGTLRGMETTEAIQLRYSGVRNGLSRITSEVNMAYLSFNRPADETRHFTLFEGRDESNHDNLTFSAFAHIRMRKDADESDQSVIQYFVEDDPDNIGQKNLYRRESRRLTGDLPEKLEDYFPAYTLVEDIDSFDVKYWDDRKQEWVDEWSTMRTDFQPDRLPPRVKIQLAVNDTDGEVVTFTAQAAPVMQEKIDL